MEKSAKRFLKDKKNSQLVLDFIDARNTVSQEVPPQLMDDLSKAIARHMKRPTGRNMQKFLRVCLAFKYREIVEARRRAQKIKVVKD